MYGQSWTCLGGGAEHLADVEVVERTLDRGNTRIAIHRCRTCGQLYRWEHYELNDWSGGGNYSDETEVWKVLDSDEVHIVRRDPNYAPRNGREHRADRGWRRDGP
ncbi:MAG TPA: hypothetical protein VEX35_00230 [Allosphingosinicella sp.]|nr:hypothetical protein [Allosphingosinicella sp.]